MTHVSRCAGKLGCWLAAAVLLLGLALGCQREPAQPTGPPDGKKELDTLKQHRQKEWGKK
jgi:hypothetical protein